METLFMAVNWKLQRWPSIDEWIKKLWYFYTLVYNSPLK